MAIDAEPSSKVRANRQTQEKKTEKSDEKTKAPEVEKTKSEKSAPPTKAPPVKKAPEKEKEKAAEKAKAAPKRTTTKSPEKSTEKAAEKATEKATEKAADKATDKATDKDKEKTADKAAKRPPTQDLPDDLLNLVANTKFESGEDKLKDVMKTALVLVRDLHKLSAAERAKKVAEAQKALIKFELQNVRAWDLQVKQRRLEVESLEAQAQKHRSGAEAESKHIAELRHNLQLEQTQHNRYLKYEEKAAEVNQKRTREEYQKAIANTTETIERLRKRRRECEVQAEQELQDINNFAEMVRKLRQAREDKQKVLDKDLEGIRPRDRSPSIRRDSRDISDSEPARLVS